MHKKMEYITYLVTSIIFLVLALVYLNLDVSMTKPGGARGLGLLIFLSSVVYGLLPVPFGKYFASVGCILISAYALRRARRIKRD
ncbi:MAG: hypothetical protein OXC07_07320 [Kistimonas sp.]|nr:hypothetical protein [Kistimonas sp.]